MNNINSLRFRQFERWEQKEKLNALPEPTIQELAKNEIDCHINGIKFETGDLDFYFELENLYQLPWWLVVRLKEIKEIQGI